MPVDGEHIKKRAEQAFNTIERKNFESIWDIITEFITPTQYKSFGATQTAGIKTTRRIFDSTAIKSNQDLSAAIHSTLTNPATQWTKLRFTNDELNNDPEAVSWLQQSNKLLHQELNESKFDQEMSKFYLLFPALGTSILFHEEKPLKEDGTFGGFRFRAIHLSEIAFSENSDGVPDVAYRKFQITARQAVERFGKENVSQKILDCMEVNPDKEFDYIHALSPRDPAEVDSSSAIVAPENRAIASVYVNAEDGTISEEGGYHEFPLHIVRWETMPNEVYGRGPGQTAIPDVRTLNKLKEHSLEQQALALRPPLLANQRAVLGTLDVRPGAIGIVKDINGLKELQTSARFDVAQLSAEELKNSIRQIFFLDKLLLPPREEIGEMSATEVIERTEQMQRVIGPVISRLNSELLQPLVLRSFKMLLRGGRLPEPPASLQGLGLDLDISFVNQLARAQQFQDVSNIQSFAQQIGMLAQLDPSAVDLLDVDAAIKHIGKIMGIPEEVITNDKDVAATREQRAQLQQAQLAMEAGVAAADIQSKTGGAQGGQ